MSGEPWRLGVRVGARAPRRALLGDAREDAELRARMTDPGRVRMLRCVRDLDVEVPGEGTVELRSGRHESQVAPNWPPLRALDDSVIVQHFDPVLYPKGVASRTTIQILPRERV